MSSTDSLEELAQKTREIFERARMNADEMNQFIKRMRDELIAHGVSNQPLDMRKDDPLERKETYIKRSGTAASGLMHTLSHKTFRRIGDNDDPKHIEYIVSGHDFAEVEFALAQEISRSQADHNARMRELEISEAEENTKECRRMLERNEKKLAELKGDILPAPTPAPVKDEAKGEDDDDDDETNHELEFVDFTHLEESEDDHDDDDDIHADLADYR